MAVLVDHPCVEARAARPQPALREWAWRLVRLRADGVAVGAALFCVSLTPSLLPRDWLVQGLIGGINAGFGYGLGVLIGKVAYRRASRGVRWLPSPRTSAAIRTAVLVLSPTACLLMVVPAAAWQRQVSALMGMPGPATFGYLRTLVVAAVVADAFLVAARLLIDACKVLARMLIRRAHLHHDMALCIGSMIVAALLITLANGVLARGFVAGADVVFAVQNTATPAGAAQPIWPERSGSPMSLVPWRTLGFEGRGFVSGGLHAAEITRVTARPAKEPIRVYAGLASAATDDDRMRLLVEELERTGAFERRLLVIVPTTGTGWINPVAARALELLYHGDTAMVGVQYSHLPSWISFLADQHKSQNSGRSLIQTVHDRWRRLPAGHRPKLVLYGESLGSMAGQSAFGWLPDIEEMGFDAVLWVGPPQASPLWQGLQVRRDPGSTQVQPRYDNGRTVRFSQAAGPNDVAAVALPPWRGARVLFLNHASDPVVWWSPDLLFSRPDWLAEPAGRDRSASMHWHPVVTFWQVSADLTNALNVPEGHGHDYDDTVLDGWLAVLPPDDWTAADTERVRAAINEPTS